MLRISIEGTEHEPEPLPADMILSNGTLDIYPDVGKLFRLIFKDGIPSIQCGGWIGYIPLNDRYALEVSPRVPIGNLERLLGMAAGYSPLVLENHTRQFAYGDERPSSLFDIFADQFLNAYDQICEKGFLKTYERRQRIGQAPFGRIDAFQTYLRSAKAGVPTALSSAYHRTLDLAENRILRYALEKLIARYAGDISATQKKRFTRVRQALTKLPELAAPAPSDLLPGSITKMIEALPMNHEEYADALLPAQLIISDGGVLIREAGGGAILPSILINMSKVFEEYVRRVLSDYFRADPRVVVKDGNVGEPTGAKSKLFKPIAPGAKNVPVTPDIVIEVNGKVKLIIDAKYKKSPEQPDRSDINQVVLYGARYGAENLMLLHAERNGDEPPAAFLGNVGDYKIYNGRTSLNIDRMADEEQRLGAAVEAILRA